MITFADHNIPLSFYQSDLRTGVLPEGKRTLSHDSRRERTFRFQVNKYASALGEEG